MSLSCLLLLLFVLNLVNHRNKELEILYVIIYLYIGNTYLPMLLAAFSTTLPPASSPRQKKIFFSRFGIFVKIHLLENSKLEL